MPYIRFCPNRELQAALGITRERALQLLEQANGCLETAAEMYYDQQGGGGEGKGGGGKGEGGGASLQSVLKDKGSSPRAAAGSKKGGGTKRADSSKKVSRRLLTRGTRAALSIGLTWDVRWVQGGGQHATPSKKAKTSGPSKAPPGSQRSITSFFAGAAPRSPAPASAPVSPAAKPLAPAAAMVPSSAAAGNEMETGPGKEARAGKGGGAEGGGNEPEEEEEEEELLALPALLPGEEEEEEEEEEEGGAAASTGGVSGGQEGEKKQAMVGGLLSAEGFGGVQGSPVNRPCARYDPVKDACWKAGRPAPYLHLAWSFELLCSTTKRLAKVRREEDAAGERQVAHNTWHL